LRRSTSWRTTSASRRRIDQVSCSSPAWRLEARQRVLDRRPADPQRLCPTERRWGLLVVEAAHVEVVDGLRDQVGDVLHERHVALDVAEHAEPVEDVLAEAVRRLDGGGVERGERLGQPPAAQLAQLRRCVAQQAQHGVAGRRLGARQDLRQPLLGGDHAAAHALAQLAGGDARERHQQQLRERRAVGHQAGGQGGDGERLPGAGAGLEQRDAGARQRAADVEMLALELDAHRSLSSSQPSTPSHSCCA
jgi:hypothetical protein